jgi:putative oxidoreductase
MRTKVAVTRFLSARVHADRFDVGILLLRTFVGVAFCFHGIAKVADLAGFAAEFHIPLMMAGAAAYTQIVGGLCLIGGLLTPAAALSLGATMGVAVAQLIARGEPFVNPGGHSWEAASFYLIANLVFLLAGPGRWSLDAILWP